MGVSAWNPTVETVRPERVKAGGFWIQVLEPLQNHTIWMRLNRRLRPVGTLYVDHPGVDRRTLTFTTCACRAADQMRYLSSVGGPDWWVSVPGADTQEFINEYTRRVIAAESVDILKIPKAARDTWQERLRRRINRALLYAEIPNNYLRISGYNNRRTPDGPWVLTDRRDDIYPVQRLINWLLLMGAAPRWVDIPLHPVLFNATGDVAVYRFTAHDKTTVSRTLPEYVLEYQQAWQEHEHAVFWGRHAATLAHPSWMRRDVSGPNAGYRPLVD